MDVFAYVTTGGKINLYIPPNPHEKVSKENALSTHSLNINRNITCIEFCALDDEEELEKKEKKMLLNKAKTKDKNEKKEKNKEKEKQKDQYLILLHDYTVIYHRKKIRCFIHRMRNKFIML